MARVGLYQGSCLRPVLFITVMDTISEHVRREVPWTVLYADDLTVADKKEVSSTEGLKININQMETMVCAKRMRR